MNSLNGNNAKKGSQQMLPVNGDARLYNHNQPWTDDESEYVKMNFDLMSLEQLASELGRTPKAIRERYRVLTHPKDDACQVPESTAIESSRRWTIEQIILVAERAGLKYESSASAVVIYKPERSA